MEHSNAHYNQQTIELIEGLIEQERAALENHRRQVLFAAEPRLKSLLVRLADQHAQSCNELGIFLNQLRSENEVTEQINNMFR